MHLILIALTGRQQLLKKGCPYKGFNVSTYMTCVVLNSVEAPHCPPTSVHCNNMPSKPTLGYCIALKTSGKTCCLLFHIPNLEKHVFSLTHSMQCFYFFKCKESGFKMHRISLTGFLVLQHSFSLCMAQRSSIWSVGQDTATSNLKWPFDTQFETCIVPSCDLDKIENELCSPERWLS